MVNRSSVSRSAVSNYSVGRPPESLSLGSARSLLLTILGEFVMPAGRPVWTATLVHALSGVGVAEKSARQAILRATTAGWLQSERDGRRVSWTLTAKGRDLINEGAARVFSMSRRTQNWDGRWLILMTSLPEGRREIRRRLYRALQWAGFGNPIGNLWICPHLDREGEARRLIHALELDAVSCAFVGRGLDIGMDDRSLVQKAWDLDQISAHYATLKKRFGKMKPLRGDAMLFAHIQLVNAWQLLPYVDPVLPNALLPAARADRSAAAALENLRNEWLSGAHERWVTLAGAS
jgi:phenylacetic acid degradation operon negative regulatory protein